MPGPVRYRIEHASRYRYASPARDCVMALCLCPSRHFGQRVRHFSVETTPPGPVGFEEDCFGNAHHVVNVHAEHLAIDIFARSEVEVPPASPPPERLEPEAWDALRTGIEPFRDWDFLQPTPLTQPTAALDSLVTELGLTPGDDPLDAAKGLSEALHDAFEYVPGRTSASSPIEHILETRAGVCQDYAHVMIAIARSWGIPARYVSGYLFVTGEDQGPAPGNATHAWVECRLPQLGWVGLDPTNRSFADQRHIRIAAGRDYRDVAPARGIRRGTSEAKLQVDVSVRRAE